MYGIYNEALREFVHFRYFGVYLPSNFKFGECVLFFSTCFMWKQSKMTPGSKLYYGCHLWGGKMCSIKKKKERNFIIILIFQPIS